MKRFLLSVFVICWFLGALYFWQAQPPLVTVVARSDSSLLHVVGFDADGNVVLGRTPIPANRRLPKRPPSTVLGPLTLHQVKTGRELATLVSSKEAIRQVQIDRGLAVTGDAWNLQVRRFGQERPLLQVTTELSLSSSLSPDGTALLTQAGSTVTLYDVPTGDLRWKRSDVTKAQWVGESAVAWPDESGNSTSIVDAQTGDLRRTADLPLPEPHQGEMSADGRYAWWAVALSADQPPGLYDRMTNERLWGLEQPSMSQFTAEQSKYFFFSDDSREVRALYAAHGDLFAVAKWNVRDGKPIEAPPANALLLVNQYQGTKNLSSDGRWYCSEFSKPLLARNPLPRVVTQRLFRTAPRLFANYVTLFTPRRHVRVVDVPSGQTVAEVPQLAPVVTIEPGGGGFLFHGGETVSRVDLPPRKDYGWLVRYGVLPPAVLIGLALLWRRRRPRARDAVPTNAVSAAEAS